MLTKLTHDLMLGSKLSWNKQIRDNTQAIKDNCDKLYSISKSLEMTIRIRNWDYLETWRLEVSKPCLNSN